MNTPSPVQRRAPRLPPPVHPGDRVGVAALSGPLDDAPLTAALEALAALGFEPVEAANLRRRSGLFAGDDGERLAAFHALADDPSIKAIFFARGGHGVLRLLPELDWRRLAATPRAYVGYSDLTPFLLEVVRRLGVVSFHGPMGADLGRGLDDAERASLLGALAGELPRVYRVAGARGGETVEGPLVGGCLSLLCATLGTPFAPETAGTLLFLEDLDEPLYRFDRMLTHLRLSGSLTAIEGLIFGHLTRVGGGRGGGPWSELLPAWGEALAGPLAWGLDAGHAPPNLTLPLGARARLEPAARRLTVGLPG